MPQKELFPPNHPTVIEHNIVLLTRYYTKTQHDHYKNIIDTHFSPEQNKDSRFISPPTNIPYTQIFINECNPEKDIITNTDTLQIINEQTHIYENTGNYLITIPTTRLKWLWQQYNKANYSSHGLIPHTQTFENEVVWLYQRYNRKITKNDPVKTTQHTLPVSIIDSITITFNISHSYFSSLVTCSTQISKFYSPFDRDKVFGSLGTAFQYKWKGIGYAHPYDEETTQQAIH